MSAAFARLQALIAMASAMQQAGASTVDVQSTLAGYRSRGKGRGTAQRSTRNVAMDKRAAVKARNRQEARHHAR